MKKLLFAITFCILGMTFIAGCAGKSAGIRPGDVAVADTDDAIAAFAVENAFAMMPMIFTIAALPFVVGLIIVSLIIIFLWKKKKAEYELMTRIVESGKDIPMDIFKRRTSKDKSLQASFAVIGCGVGMMIFFACLGDKFFPYIGLGAIPVLVGIGMLAGYYFDMKNKKRDSDI